MIYAYLRVSTDRQTVENQRYEIFKYADNKKLSNDEVHQKIVEQAHFYFKKIILILLSNVN